MSDVELERIKEVKRKYEQQWLALADVVAVGIGTLTSGKTGLIVSVKEGTEKLRALIPQKVDEVEVEVRVTGELRAF